MTHDPPPPPPFSWFGEVGRYVLEQDYYLPHLGFKGKNIAARYPTRMSTTVPSTTFDGF